MNQHIYELTDSESARLEAQRKWVREHYEPESQHKYDTLQGKINLLSAIIDNGWVEPNETVKLQCLGVAFGDALVQRLGLRWVEAQDEYGRDPALIFDGTSIKVFPLTTISKRIESGESVNVAALFEQACKNISEIIQGQAQ